MDACPPPEIDNSGVPAATSVAGTPLGNTQRLASPEVATLYLKINK